MLVRQSVPPFVRIFSFVHSVNALPDVEQILQFGGLHAGHCSLIQEWLIYLTSTSNVETNPEKSLHWLFQPVLMQVVSVLKRIPEVGSSQNLLS